MQTITKSYTVFNEEMAPVDQSIIIASNWHFACALPSMHRTKKSAVWPSLCGPERYRQGMSGIKEKVNFTSNDENNGYNNNSDYSNSTANNARARSSSVADQAWTFLCGGTIRLEFFMLCTIQYTLRGLK